MDTCVVLNGSVSPYEDPPRMSVVFISDSTEESNELEPSSSNPSGTECDNEHLSPVNVQNGGYEQYDDQSYKASANLDNDFVSPDEKLVEKIVKQVEYYFSDINIMKDTFLLKHVRRNKEGYVSLKLIASFRRVKSLTKDWRVVAYSLQRSDKLQINPEGTKIRRVDSLPEYEDTSLAKTIVAFHLPFNEPTSDDITLVFSKYGNISEIKILSPGSSVPLYAKRCLTFYKEATTMFCALVEFEQYDSTIKALAEASVNGFSEESSLKVVPLLSNSYKKAPQPIKSPKVQIGNKTMASNKKLSSPHKRSNRLEQVRCSEIDSTTSCSEAELSPAVQRRGSATDLLLSDKENGSYRRTNRNRKKNASPVNFTNKSKCVRPKAPNPSEGDGAGTSPWVHRRQMAAKDLGSSVNNSRLLIPEGVIRLPRGPDGTNGFHGNLMKKADFQISPPTLFDTCKSVMVTH